MKRLIIVRHGDYRWGGGDHLTDIGREQMAKIAKLLRPIIAGEVTVVWSSPANQAKESARILVGELGASLSINETLLSGRIGDRSLQTILGLITSSADDVDNVILIAHRDNCGAIPKYFGHNYLGVDFSYVEVGCGEGRIIDCEAKIMTAIQ